MELIEEFNNMEIDINISDEKELFAYVNSCLYDIGDEESNIKKEIIYNYCYFFKDYLVDFFSFSIDSDDTYYSDDRKLLKELMELCKKYKEYFRIILDNRSLNNVEELYKLSVMTNKYFRNNFNYIDSKRTLLSMIYSNISFNDNRYIDNREEFNSFFEDVEKVYGKVR